MAESHEKFKTVLKNKKLPILTLDNKWHQLFTQMNATKKIHKLEHIINELIKEESKLSNDEKKIKVAKKKLVEEMIQIRSDMEQQPSKELEKQLDTKTKLLNDCNEKIESNKDALLDLPEQIAAYNYELMLETMDICYKVLKGNAKEIMEISVWINEMRDMLKEKVIKRQECEMVSQDMYAYMHDIFGPDVIELFDMKYSEF